MASTETPWTVDATANDLLSLLRSAVAECEHLNIAPDPSCQQCTDGCTPANFDKGPCWYHRARALLSRVRP